MNIETSVPLHFFTPLRYSDHNHSFLEKTDGYFHLFQEIANITPVTGKERTFSVQSTGTALQSKWMITLKIISYCTLLIPLIMLMIKTVARTCYIHQATPSPLPPSQADPSSAPSISPSPAYQNIDSSLYSNTTPTPSHPDLVLPKSGEMISFNTSLEQTPLVSQPTDLPPFRIIDEINLCTTTVINDTKSACDQFLFQNFHISQYEYKIVYLLINKTIKWESLEKNLKTFNLPQYINLIIFDVITLKDVPKETQNKFTPRMWLELTLYKKIDYNDIPKKIKNAFSAEDNLALFLCDRISLKDVKLPLDRFTSGNWHAYVLYGVIAFETVPERIRADWDSKEWLELVEYKRTSLEAIPIHVQKDQFFMIDFIGFATRNRIGIDQLPSHALITPYTMATMYDNQLIGTSDFPQNIQDQFNRFSESEKSTFYTEIKKPHPESLTPSEKG